jgi:hypothetical protein
VEGGRGQRWRAPSKERRQRRCWRSREEDGENDGVQMRERMRKWYEMSISRYTEAGIIYLAFLIQAV